MRKVRTRQLDRSGEIFKACACLKDVREFVFMQYKYKKLIVTGLAFSGKLFRASADNTCISELYATLMKAPKLLSLLLLTTLTACT